jgi:hypothetical protein
MRSGGSPLQMRKGLSFVSYRNAGIHSGTGRRYCDRPQHPGDSRDNHYASALLSSKWLVRYRLMEPREFGDQSDRSGYLAASKSAESEAMWYPLE